MKSCKRPIFLCAFLSAAAVLSSANAGGANIVLWDTSSPLADPFQPDNKSTWKIVPSDLLSLEADPPKASSDPGYYGREYAFKGDAAVENRSLTAVFLGSAGKVLVFSKGEAQKSDSEPEAGSKLGVRVAEILPLGLVNPRIKQVGIVRNAEDEVVLEVSFSGDGATNMPCLFSFGRDEIVELKPSAGLEGLRLRAAFSYAVAPSFIGDDLIFSAGTDSSEKSLSIPAENFLVGLVEGESSELVLTWPGMKQSVKLGLGEGGQGTRSIDSIDFRNDGHGLYLAALSAPGIWHREVLSPSFLEKDVPVQWHPPFSARWKTQLYEENVRTTFAFKEAKGQVWRGVPGSYDYPVWFEGAQPFFHMSKKIPPQGEALIYSLEARDTPAGISTPADILKKTLGREAAEPILDVAGRELRTHHRRGADGVRRACTCGCTEAMEAVFEAGQEVTRRSYIEGALNDMIYFVHRHVERINEYKAFAAELAKFLDTQGRSSVQLKPFIDSLQQIVGQIPQECEIQKENMKSFQYADDLAQRTLALTGRSDTDNVKAYMELLKAWREMGGAQDYVVARCHMITRSLCQEAGYGCVRQPEAVALAMEVRKRCKQCLRNPDGYEIWADY
ncbi:MAG: hypothetical protein ACREIC_08295 [Limisphaerales bacterium]